ncbi:unnamed protein product [Candidula unifasciata]|uniref:Uncharacterized protein n=1 Tax=Candidula unifasciata TaxID=100452 RepID=A0A8S3YHB6_9EUPU|nr:unnamed protein product [Candidula unifasciata]
MASNMKKAGLVIRKSFRSKRYAAWEKENMSKSVTTADGETTGETSQYRARSLSTSAWSGEDENGDTSTLANPGTPAATRSQIWLKRGTSMTQSMRDAVGNLRQKMRMSTRRSRLNVTVTKVGTRRHTLGGRDAHLHSAAKVSSPRSRVKTSLSVETPTRLRREVESLTANMQALNALTPNAMEGRTRTRKAPPLTNGSLKTPRVSHRRVSQV